MVTDSCSGDRQNAVAIPGGDAIAVLALFSQVHAFVFREKSVWEIPGQASGAAYNERQSLAFSCEGFPGSSGAGGNTERSAHDGLAAGSRGKMEGMGHV
jgi:hypothetical protein